MTIFIDSERFLLRELKEDDVSEQYLSWFSDPEIRKYICSSGKTKKLEDLREYVKSKIYNNSVLFLGIFDNENGMHIGNIKYEPVDSILGYAIVGVMIGETYCRGKSVTSEVIGASARWLKLHRNINQILLGVSKNNYMAIRSYEKTGFVVAKSPYIDIKANDAISMILHV